MNKVLEWFVILFWVVSYLLVLSIVEPKRFEEWVEENEI